MLSILGTCEHENMVSILGSDMEGVRGYEFFEIRLRQKRMERLGSDKRTLLRFTVSCADKKQCLPRDLRAMVGIWSTSNQTLNRGDS
jgi:hypothetical protein